MRTRSVKSQSRSVIEWTRAEQSSLGVVHQWIDGVRLLIDTVQRSRSRVRGRKRRRNGGVVVCEGKGGPGGAAPVSGRALPVRPSMERSSVARDRSRGCVTTFVAPDAVRSTSARRYRVASTAQRVSSDRQQRSPSLSGVAVAQQVADRSAPHGEQAGGLAPRVSGCAALSLQ